MGAPIAAFQKCQARTTISSNNLKLMAETNTHDALDRQLIHALQLNGRVSFSRVGEVLGVSGQTIARRYARLRELDTLRVIGLTNASLLGEVVWLTRVHCTPDAALTIAEALARRSDTSWVQLTSGGTEILCAVRSRESGGAGSMLLQKLPRTPRVLNMTAHCVLHVFLGGAHGLLEKSKILSPEQARRLQPVLPTGRRLDLDDGDYRLLTALREDGRTSLADLAKITRWSPATVRRRMADLRDAGMLYFDVDFDPALLGRRFRALLWLSVAPAQLDQVGELLAGHPEVAYVAATTGATNLLASVLCSTASDLYEYITRRIAVLPAVNHMESAPVVRTVKNAVTRGDQHHDGGR